jgi:hypothetical protein
MTISIADIEFADDFVTRQPTNDIVETASRALLNGVLANHGMLSSPIGDERAAATASFYLTHLMSRAGPEFESAVTIRAVRRFLRVARSDDVDGVVHMVCCEFDKLMGRFPGPPTTAS